MAKLLLVRVPLGLVVGLVLIVVSVRCGAVAYHERFGEVPVVPDGSTARADCYPVYGHCGGRQRRKRNARPWALASAASGVGGILVLGMTGLAYRHEREERIVGDQE